MGKLFFIHHHCHQHHHPVLSWQLFSFVLPPRPTLCRGFVTSFRGLIKRRGDTWLGYSACLQSCMARTPPPPPHQTTRETSPWLIKFAPAIPAVTATGGLHLFMSLHTYFLWRSWFAVASLFTHTGSKWLCVISWLSKLVLTDNKKMWFEQIWKLIAFPETWALLSFRMTKNECRVHFG